MWTRPKELAARPTKYGEKRPDPSKPREPLSDGYRCGLCDERDPDAYSRCPHRICFPEPIPRPKLTAAQAGFTAPAKLMSAFTLAAAMQAKADKLPWEADEERGRLLQRARELRNGEPEVPPEDF